MTKRIGGFRRKTRYKLKKSPRTKGKISLTTYFQKLNQGQQVVLKLEPSIHKGMFRPRFYGKTGTVTGAQRGSCYQVRIKDGNKEKMLLVHPIHLKKV
jgi:large subunit ribosomal protein L21e